VYEKFFLIKQKFNVCLDFPITEENASEVKRQTFLPSLFAIWEKSANFAAQ